MAENTTDIAHSTPQAGITPSDQAFALAQRQAKALASSDLVPKAFQNNPANCLIALEIAHRMGASPMMVMQNLDIIHGKPTWSAKFLIATFNKNGAFSAIRYKWNADKSACRATATERETGEILEGPEVSLEMAKAEGWSTKAGSKWKTMPELMLMYRAATLFVRTYAPEISMGLQTADEMHDIISAEGREVPNEAISKREDPYITLLPAKDFELKLKAVSEGISTAEDIIEEHKLAPKQAEQLRQAEPKPEEEQ